MKCDICDIPGQGIHLSARQVRDAAKAGFNPFQLGLVSPAKLAALGGDDKAAYSAWLITVANDATAWNLCSPCAKKLELYSMTDTGAASQTSSADALLAELRGNINSADVGVCDLCLSSRGTVKFPNDVVRRIDSKAFTKLIPKDTLASLGPTPGTALGAWAVRIMDKKNDWGFCGDCARAVNELLPDSEKAKVPVDAPKRDLVPSDPVERVAWLAKELKKRKAPAGPPEVGGFQQYTNGEIFGLIIFVVVVFALYKACHH